MKKLCLFLLTSIITISGFSQAAKGYVYLKNGTVLKGKYLYSDDFKMVKLQSAGNLWIFESAEIDSITSTRAKRLNENVEHNLNSPFFIRSEIGVLIGNSENSQSAPFSFTASVNYLFYPKFSVGAGVGIELLKESYLPAYVNLEYKLRNSNSTPYFFLKGGYQVPLEESREVYYNDYQPWSSSFWPGPDYSQNPMDAKGGVLINPGIGYQRLFSPNFGMSFAFGYQFHRLHYTGENDYGLDIDYNRLTMKLGIIFN
jgi:hypothetical protein